MSKYKCKWCKKIEERDSDKVWIESYCEETGLMVHIYKVGFSPKKPCVKNKSS